MWGYAARGHNFLLTMLKLAREREELRVVSDQIGSPTSARLIAEITSHCLKQAFEDRHAASYTSALYHLTASGYTSWHGFAEEIIAMAKRHANTRLKVKHIIKVPSTEYPTPAKRPMNSQLSHGLLEQAYHIKMPDWKSELELYAADIFA